MANEREDVRETVREAYADAVKHRTTGGCCGDPAGGHPAAALAGYGDEAQRHGEAAGASFGCGNPVAFAHVQPGETVLDLGSGAGLDLLIAAERVGPGGRVIGVDMTDEMLETARRNVEREGRTNVELRKGVIEELPVADASVDWVVSNCVINLSPEKPRVFAEIARVLRPGGGFSISDIVAETLPEWLRADARAYFACVAGAISEAEYVQGLAHAGLVDVRVEERLVYTAAQVRAIVEADLGALPFDCGTVERALSEVEGKVWSMRVSGRKPS